MASARTRSRARRAARREARDAEFKDQQRAVMRFPGRAIDPGAVEDASHAIQATGSGGRTLVLWGSALLAVIAIVWSALMVCGMG